jgi:hypothetical protein
MFVGESCWDSISKAGYGHSRNLAISRPSLDSCDSCRLLCANGIRYLADGNNFALRRVEADHECITEIGSYGSEPS